MKTIRMQSKSLNRFFLLLPHRENFETFQYPEHFLHLEKKTNSDEKNFSFKLKFFFFFGCESFEKPFITYAVRHSRLTVFLAHNSFNTIIIARYVIHTLAHSIFCTKLSCFRVIRLTNGPFHSVWNLFTSCHTVEMRLRSVLTCNSRWFPGITKEVTVFRAV